MADGMTKNSPRTLLPGELELQRWGGLVLTTHRLMLISVGSTSSVMSLLLRDVGWSRIGRTHQPALIVVAILAGLAGLFLSSHSAELALACGVAALIAVFVYLRGRGATMLFAAGEGRIEIGLKGDKKSWEGAGIFANAVEHAALRTTSLT